MSFASLPPRLPLDSQSPGAGQPAAKEQFGYQPWVLRLELQPLHHQSTPRQPPGNNTSLPARGSGAASTFFKFRSWPGLASHLAQGQVVPTPPTLPASNQPNNSHFTLLEVTHTPAKHHLQSELGTLTQDFFLIPQKEDRREKMPLPKDTQGAHLSLCSSTEAAQGPHPSPCYYPYTLL